MNNKNNFIKAPFRDFKMKFPEVSGSNLEFREYNIPYDLDGQYNIVIIPFWRSHQVLVDQWATFLNTLTKKYPDLEYYETPTLSIGYKLMRFMIDGGMRAGIQNKRIRERTITLYINKRKFRNTLDIPTERTISLFLINREGDILWRCQGEFSSNKAEELKKVLFELNA